MKRLNLLLAVISAMSLSFVTSSQDRGWATSIAWSPDGETIAIGASTGIWLFDTDFNEVGYVPTPEMRGFSPTTIDWNAAGDLLAIALAREIAILGVPALIVDAKKKK